VSRAILVLTLSLTAADALGAGRFAVCRMQVEGPSEEPGCGHCPPAASPVVRDGLPDCCVVHAAARSAPAPSEEAVRSTRQGPSPSLVPVLAPTVVATANAVPAQPALVPATAPPRTRNLPLLR
jgi:hypothetical protein